MMNVVCHDLLPQGCNKPAPRVLKYSVAPVEKHETYQNLCWGSIPFCMGPAPTKQTASLFKCRSSLAETVPAVETYPLRKTDSKTIRRRIRRLASPEQHGIFFLPCLPEKPGKPKLLRGAQHLKQNTQIRLVPFWTRPPCSGERLSSNQEAPWKASVRRFAMVSASTPYPVILAK